MSPLLQTAARSTIFSIPPRRKRLPRLLPASNARLTSRSSFRSLKKACPEPSSTEPPGACAPALRNCPSSAKQALAPTWARASAGLHPFRRLRRAAWLRFSFSKADGLPSVHAPRSLLERSIAPCGITTTSLPKVYRQTPPLPSPCRKPPTNREFAYFNKGHLRGGLILCVELPMNPIHLLLIE